MAEYKGGNMAYQKHQWYTGEVILATTLNHMEEGIEKASKAIETATDEDIDELFAGTEAGE